MINFSWILRIAVLLALFSSTAFAKTDFKDGYEVMKAVDFEMSKPSSVKSSVYMQIFDKSNSKRERYFNETSKNLNGKKRTLLLFYKPSTVKNTAILSESYTSKTEIDQWIYLPSFDSINKIASENKNDSFMGSDLTYKDIAGRLLNEDTHELSGQDESFYFVTSIPKSGKDQYSKLEVIVRKDIMLPSRIIFYDKSGKKLKVLTNKSFESSSGINFVKEVEVKNEQTGGKTLITRSSVEFNTNISESSLGIKGLK